MSEVLDLFLKTVDRYCVFDMVGIVFASFFYCYYMPRSSMFITYIQHEWRTLILHEHTALVKSKPSDLKHSRQSYSRYLLRPFHQRLFFFQSARSRPACPRWINVFWSARLSSWIALKSDRLLFFNMFKKIADQNRRHVVVLVVRLSGEGGVLTLSRHCARPSVESGRGYTKAPEARRDKGTFRGPSNDQDDNGTTVFDRVFCHIGYCFSTC